MKRTCSPHGVELPMWALTLDQPGAWAFCHGQLVVNEDEAPSPPLRGGEPVAIYAGLTNRSLVEFWNHDYGEWNWPVGRKVPPPPETFRPLMAKGQLIFDPFEHVKETGDAASVLGAVVAVATFQELVTGRLPATSGQRDFWAGQRFAWLFSRSDPLSIPVPCTGKRKLWRLSPGATKQVIEIWQRGLM